MIDAPTFYDRQARDEYFKAAAKRPKCSWCEEPIWEDEAYKIDGNWICKTCMEDCKEYIWEEDAEW